MRIFMYAVAAGLAIAAHGGASLANTVTVTPTSTSWGTTDGNASITSDAPRAGDGSVRLQGDRTRFFGLGNPFDSASNLGLLSDLDAFSFDWRVDPASTSQFDADYTPALRLHIFDGAQRSELIWEGAYNGVYGNATKGEWYAADMFGTGSSFGADPNVAWRFQTGLGETNVNGALGLFSISDWAADGLYSNAAYIAAISVGVGSGVGTGYLAYADNVRLGFAGGEATTYNFEVQPIPVPAALPLLASGLGLMALIRRRRKAGA